MRKIGCVIMASGYGKRFGSNKLLADFCGKLLIQRILDITEEMFEKRVVVTRSEEIREVCTKQRVQVIFHNLPNRNDTIRLGVEVMEDMEACIFCPSDQPLLRRESLKALMESFENRKRGIHRLIYENQEGTPILFGKEYYAELKNLPEKSGGSYLVKKYPEKVTKVSAFECYELMDVDKPEDLERLCELCKKE
ncbi:MAG: nucleotidyltransferase family protein [Lachnospiraceae bacterium]|nr:nucleotidyltransferase family protein [Lachnospiraceae bacterium]